MCLHWSDICLICVKTFDDKCFLLHFQIFAECWCNIQFNVFATNITLKKKIHFTDENPHVKETSLLLRSLFCIHICKWFISYEICQVHIFSYVVLVPVSVGQFYHSFCVMDWSPESWLWYSSGSFLMYCVIYISAPLRFSRYLIVEYSASFHRTSTTHTAMRAPVGKRRISFTLSFIPTSIFMAHFACSGGCYGPAELDPGILCSLLFFPFLRDCSFFFPPLHDTRCKWALGGTESVALNVDFCGTSGSLSHKLMKQIYDGCWAQQIKLTVMYGGLMPPWSLHSTTGRSLPGYTLVRIC